MSNYISYFSEEINFELENKKKTTVWLTSLIKLHQKIVGEISYIFCSDSYLLEINKEHLNHNYFTDIITFNYNQTAIISGDIFISIDRIKENSKEYEVSFKEELNRVMAHGILHLIGFNDKSKKEQIIMTDEENKALELLNTIN